jgi:hypothetical protein
VEDFFAVKLSKKEELFNFIRDKLWCKTSDIIAWGSKNYYNRAERTARDLASEGKIRRMSEEHKTFRFKNIKEDVWELV